MIDRTSTLPEPMSAWTAISRLDIGWLLHHFDSECQRLLCAVGKIELKKKTNRPLQGDAAKDSLRRVHRYAADRRPFRSRDLCNASKLKPSRRGRL